MAEIRIDFRSSGAKRTLAQIEDIGKKARGSIDPVRRLADDLERLFTAEERSRAQSASKGIQNLGRNSTRASKEAQKLADTIAQIFTPRGQQQRSSQIPQIGTEARQATKDVNLLSSALNGVGNRLGALAVDIPLRAISNAIGGLGGFIGGAVDEFAAFDKALFDFAQKAGVPRESLGDLADQAKELAAVTSQTPTGVAQTADALLALGATAEEVTQNLEGVVKTADVLGEDPVLTGQVIQSGLLAFGQFGETSESLGDKLLTLKDTTAALSQGGLGEIEQLFSKAAPTAAELGVSIDELGAAFGVLRNASIPAEVAATGLRIVLSRLSSPAGAAGKALKDLKINAFDAQGEFVGLENVLRQFQRATEDLTQQERLQALNQIFGEQGTTPILALLSELDTGFSDAANNLQTSGGRVESSLEIINASLSRQRELLSGLISSVQTDLGEAIAPISGAFIALSRDVLNAATDGTTAFDTLGAAGRRFGEALGENPAIVEQLAQALQRTIEAVSELVAAGLDRIAEFLDRNANAAGDLADTVADTLIGALEAAAAAVQVLFTALELLVPLLSFLSENTGAVVLGLQAFGVAVAGIKIAALVKGVLAAVAAFKALAVTVGAFVAGGGIAAIGTAAIALAPALLAAAAAAGVLFTAFKTINTAGIEENFRTLDKLQEGIDEAAEAGFNLANQLRNAREATDELTEAGGRLSDEDRRNNAELLANAQERIQALQDERKALEEVELRGRGGNRKRQEAALENQKQQLDSTIQALERQVELFEESEQAAEEAARATEEQAIAATEGVPQFEEAIDLSLETLRKGFAEQNALLAQQRARVGAEIAEAGKTPVEAQQAILDADKDFLDERLKLQEQFVKNLEAAIAAGDASEETAAALVAAETELFQLRTQVIEDAEKRRIDILRSSQEEARRILQEADAERQQSLLQLEQALRRSGQSEVEIREAVAAETNRIERESLEQQIELAEERLELAGEGTQQERDALIELSQLRNNLLRNQIAAEQQARDAQINAIQRTAALARIAATEEIDAAQQREAANDRIIASLQRQNTLIDAQITLQRAIAGLQEAVANQQANRLQQALAARRRAAEIEQQLAEDAQLSDEQRTQLARERRSLEQQITRAGLGRGANEQRILQEIIRDQRQRFEQEQAALERTQQSERLSLELEIQRNRIAAERSVREEEIALRRLELQRQELETEIQLARLRGDDVAAAGAESSLRLLDEQLEGQREIIALAREAAEVEQQAAEVQLQALEAQQQAEALGLAAQQQETAARLAQDAQEAGGRALRDAERLVTETDRRAREEERVADTLATSLSRTDNLLDSQRQLLETTIRLADEQERFANAVNTGARGGSLPSFRSGGVAPGGQVQVHKDEIITLPRGSVVSAQTVSRSEQRRLARAAFTAQALPQALQPLGRLSASAIGEVPGVDNRAIRQLLKEVRSLQKVMSKGGVAAPTVVQNFPRNDAPTRRDAAADAWFWASRF